VDRRREFDLAMFLPVLGSSVASIDYEVFTHPLCVTGLSELKLFYAICAREQGRKLFKWCLILGLEFI